MKEFTAVDAFCGAGGLSIGISEAGFNILMGFDTDALCIETLNSNPQFVKHKAIKADVKEMLNNRLLRKIKLKRGELDLLAGGPPCQGFSVQRTIGGDIDNRNLLVDDYADLIEEVLPKFFLMENVPGIGGKRGKDILSRFKIKMEKLGYFCHESIVDAQNYGVPQRRKRYILIGEYTGGSDPKFTWPILSRRKRCTVRDVIGSLPPPPEDGSEHPKIAGHRADKLSKLNRERLMALKPGEGRDSLPKRLLAKCHQFESDKIGHRNVYGRMDWDDVAPTITARFDSFTRGKFGHPEQTRSISLYEGALLQTFPKKYRFIGNKVDIARQIGNAVPPKLATVLAKGILNALVAKECEK